MAISFVAANAMPGAAVEAQLPRARASSVDTHLAPSVDAQLAQPGGEAPPPAGADTGARPSGSILPKPSAPAPREFTLADRFFFAAQRGDIAAAQVCLDKGIDPKIKDEVGRSALALAVRDGRSLEMARFLASHGVPVDEPDAMGRSPLHEAAGNGSATIVAWLVGEHARVDRHDVQGRTPLHSAVLGGSREAVATLLQAGADPNARDNFDDTPLLDACNKGVDEIARLLVDKGADPTVKDQEGRGVGDRGAEATEYCRSLAAGKPK